MFTTNLFSKLKTTQIPIDRRMDKLRASLIIMESYSAMKRNESLIYTKAWMNLTDVMLSEADKHKSRYIMIP